MTIGVLGAGMAGLSFAQRVKEPCVLVDKGRGPGGRMASRRAPWGHFDHGAQYFTARSDGMDTQAQSWVEEGLAQLWAGRVGVAEQGRLTSREEGPKRYVGTPTMSAIPKALARSLDVRLSHKVLRVERLAGDVPAYQLHTESEVVGPFSKLVLTAPPAQSAALLGQVAPKLAARVQCIPMEASWALMVTFAEPLPLAYDGIFFNGGRLTWAMRNTSKPGREGPQAWVVHGRPAGRLPEVTTPELVRENAATLLEAFFEEAQIPKQKPEFLDAHLWRYARILEPAHKEVFWEPELQIGVCGDWCQGGRVEGAVLSGWALADAITQDPTGSKA